jgi:hemolysin III
MDKLKINFNSEIISSTIHFIGFILSIIAVTFLIVYASAEKDAWKIVSFSIYGVCLMFLFLISSIYHGVNHSEELKEKLRTFDYIGIFLLIAGTFTPICLVLLRGLLGWTLFGIIWFLALGGIIIRSLKAPIWITSPMYLIMGWLALVIAVPVYNFNPQCFLFLLIGGLFYTLGFVIFSIQLPKLIEGKFTSHEVWHILVLLGAISHFIVMYKYIL